MTASTDILKTGDLSSIAIPRLATDTYGAQRLRQRYAAGVPLRSTIGRIGKGSVNHDSIRNKPNAASAVLVQEVLAMNKHYWNKPVALRLPQRGVHEIENTYEAAAMLLEAWPADHGEAYDRALRTCLLSIRGKRLPSTARRAFIDAANEAHIHIKIAA
jgi:hypothetical protein